MLIQAFNNVVLWPLFPTFVPQVSQRLLLLPFNKFKAYLDVSSVIFTEKHYGLKSYFLD